MRDGLGGEELQVSGLQTGGTNISPYFTGSITAGSVMDFNGKLQSVSLGSPGKMGALIQAGSLGTAAGSSGFIAFRTNFGDTEYSVALTPWSGTSTQAFTSGVQNVSGVNVVGEASGRYQYIAVGNP